MEGAHPAIAAAEVGVPAAPINAPTRSRASELEYVRARLALLPFLDELLSDRVREVARQVRLITCEDGGSLFDAGDVSGPLFAITSGTAVVELSGEPTSLVTVHEGEVAGAVSALFGDRRRGNARARGKLEAFAFAPSLVRALAVEYGTFRAYLDNIARARVAESLPRAAVGVRGIDQATRRQLFESCDWVTMPEGALLQLEGVAAGAIYFIGAGEAEVFGPSVDSRHVQRIGVGALIGAGSLRDDSFAVVNVRASTRLLVARLAGAKYRRFAAAHSDAARALGAASAG